MKYLIGIDIGGTKIATVIGDERATILGKKSFKNEISKGPVHSIKLIIQSIYYILSENRIKIGDVLAIGISCGGPMDRERGILKSPPNLPGWDNIPIVETISNEFSVITGILNDANACALAEWKWGAGRGCNNMVFLTYGTGLGAGLIVNGQLLHGANDNAGEIGHIRMESTGPWGYYKEGSLEGFCSGSGIAQLAKSIALKLLNRGKSLAFCSSYAELENINAKIVAEAAKQGDHTALKVFEISGSYLGQGLALLIDILNLERIVIGGIFSRCESLIRPSMESEIKKEALLQSSAVCEIVPSGLGERIGDYSSLVVAQNITETYK